MTSAGTQGAATAPSAIGNVADLREGQVLLPAFVGRRPDGLFIDLLAIDSRGLITEFVQRVFASGARFVGLDYDLFLKLLFLWEPADIDRQLAEFKSRGQPPQVRLAADIVPFGEERRAIYRAVKILDGGRGAEYMFEQVSVEREVDDPESPEGRRTVSERLYADFDEFVAALWEKGVRFGIDAKAVREAIERDKQERLTVARFVEPREGKDAGVDEQTDLLHRDNAPRRLADGRIDLAQFRNRFPQVSKGTRLFKKIPRIAGTSGWDVAGKEIAPKPIKDFEIDTLAGPGTEVVRDADMELVVAAQDGFLDIDAQSGKISVVDKIVSREGVSMRTTGDLALQGEEYEEHGEVQERRTIKGRHMSFFADVFGNIVSDGGRVTFKRNLSGGTVASPRGEVMVEGAASRSEISVPDGSFVANHAENCVIIGGKVRIGRAIRCDIVADEVAIEISEGSAVAARKIAVKTATTRKGEASTLTVLLPDLARFDAELVRLHEAREASAGRMAKFSAAQQTLVAQPDMKSYLALQPKIKAKAIVMSAAQQAQWQALLARIAPTLRQVAALNSEIQSSRQAVADTEAEIAAVAEARRAAGEGLFCKIEAVAGDAVVYKLRQSSEDKTFAGLPAKELYKRLREPGARAVRLFYSSSGSFEWQPAEGDEEDAAPSGQD